MSDARPLAERLRLVVLTDPDAVAGLLPAAHAALQAGAPAIQLRWKNAAARDLFAIGLELRRLTRDAGALLFVNDRLDVALSLGADGVHLGDDDIPLPVARRLAPTPFLIGRSVDTPEQAAAAEAAGADYLGAGPVYPTTTKIDAGPVMGIDGIGRVARAAALPVVGIGGIGLGRAAATIAAGAAGVAVLGAVMSSAQPGEVVVGLLAELDAAFTAAAR